MSLIALVWNIRQLQTENKCDVWTALTCSHLPHNIQLKYMEPTQKKQQRYFYPGIEFNSGFWRSPILQCTPQLSNSHA